MAQSSYVFVSVPEPYAAGNVLGSLLLGVLLTQARSYLGCVAVARCPR